MKIPMILMAMALWAAGFVKADAQMLEIKKMIEGTVQIVGNGSINVMDQNQRMEAQIWVDSSTQYEGIQSSMDLKVGDPVKVEYTERDSKKIADVVTRPDTGEEGPAYVYK